MWPFTEALTEQSLTDAIRYLADTADKPLVVNTTMCCMYLRPDTLAQMAHERGIGEEEMLDEIRGIAYEALHRLKQK